MGIGISRTLLQESCLYKACGQYNPLKNSLQLELVTHTIYWSAFKAIARLAYNSSSSVFTSPKLERQIFFMFSVVKGSETVRERVKDFEKAQAIASNVYGTQLTDKQGILLDLFHFVSKKTHKHKITAQPQKRNKQVTSLWSRTKIQQSSPRGGGGTPQNGRYRNAPPERYLFDISGT